MKEIRMWAALLVAGMTLNACSSDDNEVLTESELTQPQTFTLTVMAQKGGDTTRGVLTDGGGSTITATWEVGDQVDVYNKSNSSAFLGTLTAQTAGSSTTLKGTLSGTIAIDNQLELKYKSANYATQAGTLEDIATNRDYATATVTVTGDSDGKIITGDATFESQQAIVKFTLWNSDATQELSADKLEIIVDNSNSVNTKIDTYTVTPTTATSTLYVAIPQVDGKRVKLVATVGTDIYYSDRNVYTTFTKGEYYRVKAKLTESTTLAALKTNINNSINCNSFVGYQVDASGRVAPSGLTPIGYIAYISTDNVDTGVDGSRILVLASEDANGGNKCYWTSSTEYNNLKNNTDGMCGYTFTNNLCSGTHPEHYPAANAAWTYSGSQPSGASQWFLPTMPQMTAFINALGGLNALRAKYGWKNSTYWSSTEEDQNNACIINSFNTWSYDNKHGYNQYYVRACFAY